MNLAQRLIDCTAKERKTILVIGDAMTDVWIHGTIHNCQDGCNKFVEASRHTSPGGAANAARSLGNWPATVHLFAWAENDRPIKTRFIESRRTPSKVAGNIVIRWDDESRFVERNQGQYEWARTDAVDAIRDAGAVLLSDYDKGFLPPEFIREVANACVHRSIPCVADCKRAPDVYPWCILQGNYLYSMHHARQCDVVTYGRNNPFVNGSVYGPDMPYVKCVNHVGAGDCFAAHLTLALAYGFSLKEAAALAHSAGRVYVQHEHNRPPMTEEIVADLATAM